MTQTVPSTVPEDTRSESGRPYPPSWIDRLLARMERLPVPLPVVLIGLWLAFITIVHVTVWREGILATGQIDARVLVINTWAPYGLGFIYYLEKTAADALAAFRPALDMSDGAFDDLRYRFTTMPRVGVLIITAVGALLAFVTLQMFPETAEPFMDTPLAAVVNTTLSMASAAVLLAVIYQTFRQLRLIRRTYAQASKLDLFRTNELYAFSSLTLRMGIGWLVIIYASALLYPALTRNIPWAGSSILVVVGVAVYFVRTLVDIHQGIASVKAQRLLAVDRRLQEAFDGFHQRVDSGEPGSLVAQKEVMEVLLLERGFVAKLPTWPWQSGTLASFLTAILLPLIVWSLQEILQRIMGL